jgi:ketosteroid isomerase-like protein
MDRSVVTELNRHTVQAAFERWRAGTGGPFELLSETARWTIIGSSPLSRTYTSREQFLQEVILPFNARMASPLVPTVHGLHVDGDMVVVHFNGTATARNGQEYHNAYSWHLRLLDGQIVEATAFFDTRLFDELWRRVTPAP